MQKIVILYSGGRHWGGIEAYLANLFRLYDRGKMELRLASLGEWELTRAVASAGIPSEVELLSSKRFRLRTVRDLRRLLVREKAALIVSQGTVANAYARLAALVAGVPSLTVVHSDMELDYPRGVARWVYRLCDRALRPITKSYIAVSAYLKDRVVRSGVRPEMVRVVYNGVDNASARLKTARGASGRPQAGGGGYVDTASASSDGGNTISLASVGRLHPVKNFDVLIASLRLLPDQTTLTIWGDGGERSNLEALVDEMGLSQRVRLPGESQDMGQALEGADIYLQPSKSEGCSFAVAEAMLHGKPVVVTPCGGLPEQVGHRATGLVAADCSPEAVAEAVSLLLDDRGLAERLGRAGRAAAEEMYDMSKWLRETTTAFCEAAREDSC